MEKREVKGGRHLYQRFIPSSTTLHFVERKLNLGFRKRSGSVRPISEDRR